MFLREWKCPDEVFSVVIEDDDRVAYAYMCEHGKIVGDVWLYNVESAPPEPEWNDRTRVSFLNPLDHALENDVGPITSDRDVEILWRGGEPFSAMVRILGLDWAIVMAGEKPGWCRLAKQSGPLAKRLDEF